MRQVIINADDYGASSPASRGIVQAHMKGIVTSTTVMINTASRADIMLLKDCPRLGVGLHLNIASGSPVSDPSSVESLLDGGRFTAPNTFEKPMWDEFAGRLVVDEVEREFRAQLELFRRRLGFMPDHLDTHYHAAGHPKIFSVYARLAQEYRLPARMPVWITNRGTFRIVPSLTRKLREKCRTTDNGFFGYFCDRNDSEKEFIRTLARVGDGVTEFMFHPGLYNRRDWTSIVNMIDLEILTNKEVRQVIKKNGIRLTNFRTAFPPPPRRSGAAR